MAKRINKYTAAHPEAEIIRMGIGDVTRPLAPEVIKALHEAVDDEARGETFHGYGPEQGYTFLTEKIAETDYRRIGVDIATDEIFVSDGAKCDTGNIGDILAISDRVAVTDPVYPVYVDTNIMAGRSGDLLADGRWSDIEYLPCTADNDFVPELPKTNPDIIYLCYPNNPTGTTLTHDQLKIWVDYCRRQGSLLLFDAAYEAFITESDVPHSIFEIEGARECAIEFRSFSKTAGFTGIRLGYAVIPKELKGADAKGNPISLNALWNRRQTTKFNGASYLTQRAAAATYSEAGRRQLQETIDYYRQNARVIKDALEACGYTVYGAVNSPYVWCETPGDIGSWEFFDILLERCGVITTPGAGFGPAGEGYIRFTAFGDAETTKEAMRRIEELSF